MNNIMSKRGQNDAEPTRAGDLPDGMRRPVQLYQRTLFPESIDDALARLHVSPDDVDRWHGWGWLSLGGEPLPSQLDEPQLCELEFVRDLARSGLSNAQVNEWTADLRKPFRYNPRDTACCFSLGWVHIGLEPEEPDVVALVEENVDGWLRETADEGDFERLAEIAELIRELTESAG